MKITKNFTCISCTSEAKDYSTGYVVCLMGSDINYCLSADDLSFKAITSQSTTHEGQQNLYDASNAVDRNIATCMRTKQIGLTSPNRVDWWKVDLGKTSNIYSINILFKNYENYGMYHFDCINSERGCSYTIQSVVISTVNKKFCVV